MRRVAITGSSGLIGGALLDDFEARGHEVTRVVRGEGAERIGRGGRGAPEPGYRIGGRVRTVAWDPARGLIDAEGLEGHDIVIHLAAEPISGLWTKGKRARIRESRIEGTRLLAETLAGLTTPPRLLLTASAVGYYGDHPPGEAVDEGSGPGEGFLAETVVAWEGAAEPAVRSGIRVVYLRFGIVLSAAGGMLRAIMPIFRLGLGARLGSGRQMVSWVALSEIPSIIDHLIETGDHEGGDHEGGDLEGPVNIVSPNPVSNAELTTTLGRALRRPALFRAPASLLRLAGGEQAEEMVLSGTSVHPRRLLESGYRFRYPDLDGALHHELGEARVARLAASE